MPGDFRGADSNVWGKKASDPLRCSSLPVPAFSRGWEPLSAVLVVLCLSFRSTPKAHLLVVHFLQRPPRCSSCLLHEVDQATEQEPGVSGGE